MSIAGKAFIIGIRGERFWITSRISSLLKVFESIKPGKEWLKSRPDLESAGDDANLIRLFQ